MTPLEAFLIACLTGVGSFTGWLIRWAIKHLESDLAYSRHTAHRGTETAEKAAAIAEETA